MIPIVSALVFFGCGDAASPIDGGRDAGATRVDGGGDAGLRACFHDVCAEGSYLEPGCDPCTAAVCATDDVCCTIAWDDYCVRATRDHAECTCGEETDCGNLRDDDLDDDIDCADSGCAGDPVCVPGTGAIGERCSMHSDCRGAGGPPICLGPEQGYGGGSCSAFCDPAVEHDCGDGAVCVDDGVGVYPAWICIPVCDPLEPTSCRIGYECVDRGGVNVCVPRREECDTPEDDDADGRVNCADRDCTFEPACAEICDNGLDDTGDGAVDCDDYTCLGRVECDEPI
jgi:hypothetical protein